MIHLHHSVQESLFIQYQYLLPATVFIVFGLVVWIVGQRLYFHPLSKIPGPRIAAVSRFYEFYYNIIQEGQFVRHIGRLHETYQSPVIRIAPNHVHVNNPETYHEIYKIGTKYTKPKFFYGNFGLPASLPAQIDSHRHRICRTVVGPMFSPASVADRSPAIATVIRHAAEEIRRHSEQDRPINMQQLYRRLTADGICQVGFGKCLNLVHGDNPEFLESIDVFVTRVWTMLYFPIITQIGLSLPRVLSKRILPGYMHFRELCETWVHEAFEKHRLGGSLGGTDCPTLFDMFFVPHPEKGYEVPPVNEMVDHAFALLLGGTDTAAYTLACGTYHLLDSPQVLARLRKELDEVTTEIQQLNWKIIQKLPYLTAVVKEMTRLASSVPGLLPRVVPPGGTVIGSHFIPSGTYISISTHTIHDNPLIFQNPEAFVPERWLGAEGKALEKWNVAFSKGSRRCLGKNLADVEMYMCVAYIFSRYDLEVYNTDASDIEWLDYVVALNKKDVEVRVIRDRWEPV